MGKSTGVEMMVVTLSDEVKELQDKMEAVLARLGVYDGELKKTVTKREFKELSDDVEDHGRDIERLVEDVAVKAAQHAVDALTARMSSCEAGLLEKAGEAAFSNLEQQVLEVGQNLRAKASSEAVTLLSEELQQTGEDVKLKASCDHVLHLQQTLDEKLQDVQKKLGFTLASNVDTAARFEKVEEAIRNCADRSSFERIKNKTETCEKLVAEKFSCQAAEILNDTVKTLQQEVDAKASDKAVQLLSQKCTQNAASIAAKAGEDSFVSLHSRVNAVELDLYWKASGKEFALAMKRLESLEADMQDKGGADELSLIKQRLDILAKDCANKAFSNEVQTLSDKLQFCMAKAASAVEKTEMAMQRQRVGMLEKEMSSRAYTHELHALREQCEAVRNGLDACARADSLQQLAEKIDMNAEAILAEREQTTEDLTVFKRDMFSLRNKLNSKPDYMSLPLAPNLLRDSKKFQGLCRGLRGTEMNWDEGGFGGDWHGYIYRKDNPGNTAGVNVKCSVQVIDLSNAAKLANSPLMPFGQLDAFITDQKWSKDPAYFAGADVCCVILDVRITQDADGNGSLKLLCQNRTPLFTSYDRGPFFTQVSVFCNVLESEGETRLRLFMGRGAGVRVDGTSKGLGWRHYHACRVGFGEEESSTASGVGRLRVAIALPYLAYGYHGGIPVWSGYVADYYAQDTIALTASSRAGGSGGGAKK
ncbi:unnamed protein product [Amoebophrya sp. A25]|nr:unnamed protein product [Amoebophrya sp. A25]|eukprot:GSA25T00022753001.1